MLSLNHLRARFGTVGLGLLTLLCVHCGSPSVDSGSEDAPSQDPGTTASAQSPDVSCSTDENCATGESCNGGVCQLPRCSEPPNPASPPLGNVYHLTQVQQLLAAGSTTAIHGFEGATLSAIASGSWSAA